MSYDTDTQHMTLGAHAGELPLLDSTDDDVFAEIADMINETYA